MIVTKLDFEAILAVHLFTLALSSFCEVVRLTLTLLPLFRLCETTM